MKRTLLLGAATALMFSTGVVMAQSSTGTPSAQSGATQQQQQNKAQDSATQQSADKQKQNPALAPNAVGDKSAMSGTASLDQMMGKDVYDAEGKKLGSIEDIILDPTTGKAQLAVIERGGLLGIGGKSFAVDYTLIGMEGDRLVAKQVTEDQAKAMPEFKYEDNAVSYNRNKGQATQGQGHSGSTSGQHMNQGGAGSGVGGTAPAGAPNSTPKQ